MKPVYAEECSCVHMSVAHTTDESAAHAAWVAWRERLRLGGNAPKSALYWSIHGPGGHVIGLRGSPVGDLPAPPPSG